jgi:hypothetical protein
MPISSKKILSSFPGAIPSILPPPIRGRLASKMRSMAVLGALIDYFYEILFPAQHNRIIPGCTGTEVRENVGLPYTSILSSACA